MIVSGVLNGTYQDSVVKNCFNLSKKKKNFEVPKSLFKAEISGAEVNWNQGDM